MALRSATGDAVRHLCGGQVLYSLRAGGAFWTSDAYLRGVRYFDTVIAARAANAP